MTDSKPVKLSTSEANVLRFMRDEHKFGKRIRLDGDEFWVLDDQRKDAVIRKLIKKQLLWAHYPTGAASCGINEAGEAALLAHDAI